jgi:hypothetical protein
MAGGFETRSRRRMAAICFMREIALPPDQATALWQIAHAEAQLAIGP